MPPVPPELANNIGNPNYWLSLVAKLTKQIPPVTIENPPKEDKMADRVAWRNPKVYDGKHYPVVSQEWLREVKKIFTVVEVQEEKKVKIRTFYLTGEDDIWYYIVKVGSQGLNSLGVISGRN